MKKSIATLLTGTALAGIIAFNAHAAQSAADDNQVEIDAPILEITKYLGTIKIRTTTGDAIEITKQSGTSDFSIDQNGNDLKINGGHKKFRYVSCENKKGDVLYKKKGDGFFGGGSAKQKLSDQAHLEIAVPVNTIVNIDKSFYAGEIGDIGGADIHLTHCGDLTIGNISGVAKLSTHGSGSVTVGSINESDVELHGSGSISGLSASDMNLDLHGSGSADFGDVGAIDADLHGSGSISLGDVDGEMFAELHGSGSIRADNIRGGLRSESHGSGSISLISVNGPIDIESMGSGGVKIKQGRASAFSFEGMGSGSVYFGGTAVNPEVDVKGSGRLTLGAVEGDVRGSTKKVRIENK